MMLGRFWQVQRQVQVSLGRPSLCTISDLQPQIYSHRFALEASEIWPATVILESLSNRRYCGQLVLWYCEKTRRIVPYYVSPRLNHSKPAWLMIRGEKSNVGGSAEVTSMLCSCHTSLSPEKLALPWQHFPVDPLHAKAQFA